MTLYIITRGHRKLFVPLRYRSPLSMFPNAADTLQWLAFGDKLPVCFSTPRQSAFGLWLTTPTFAVTDYRGVSHGFY